VVTTLQTAYCDLTQQLAAVTVNITSSSPIYVGSSGSAARPRSWESVIKWRKQVIDCSQLGREFPKPGPWPNCSGDETRKPVLIAQQVIAFALFLGSTGVAFGLLLSMQAEGELNEGWERCVTWVPFVCFSGFAMLLGLAFLLTSLVTMGEVQYGPWQNWHDCGIPWISNVVVGLVSFGVFCALVGVAGFFNGWKVV
jgi:hypothetical protein